MSLTMNVTMHTSDSQNYVHDCMFEEIFVSRLQYNNSISCIPIYFLHESTPSVSDICLVYQYITIHIRDIKNMKIVFQFNIAI